MIGAGGVDAMFITDHLPELPGKSKESSTSQGPDNYAPLLLCELQIRLWRALPKDLAFLLPACHTLPLATCTFGKTAAFTAWDVRCCVA